MTHDTHRVRIAPIYAPPCPGCGRPITTEACQTHPYREWGGCWRCGITVWTDGRRTVAAVADGSREDAHPMRAVARDYGDEAVSPATLRLALRRGDPLAGDVWAGDVAVTVRWDGADWRDRAAEAVAAADADWAWVSGPARILGRGRVCVHAPGRRCAHR